MATVRERVTDTIKVVRSFGRRRPRPVKPKYAGESWTVNDIDRKSSRQSTPRGAMSGIQIRNGIWYPMVRPESLVMLTDMVWIVGATIDRSIEESTKGGYRFDPKFGAKCLLCGAEYDSKPEECETEGCGGMEFEEADPKLLEPVNLLLDRPNWDDETQRVYKPTGDLLRDAVYYMLVIDDWHWEVIFDETQESPAQLWPVNSEFMRQFADPSLTIGKYFCPECLERKGIGKATYDKEIEECPECNTTLLKTAWAQINEQEEIVAIWAKQEILHDQARARGKRVLGRSKVLRCWAMAQILRWMEVHQWSLYSGQHDPANFISIPWMTQAEVNEMMADWSKFQEDHPTYSGSMWLGLASSMNPEQKGGSVQVNNLMGSLVDLDAVNLAMHYTKAICMNFGVSPEMIGVQEAGKLGHPEEVLQVSYDTIQEIQTQLEDFVNYQLMPFFPEAAEQWVFKMNPPAPEDEKKKADEAMAWMNVLNALRQAGAEATLDPSIEKDWPIQIKSWHEPMPPPGQLGGMPGEAPPGQSETPPPEGPGQGPGEGDEPLPFPSFLARKGLVSRKPWTPYTGPHGGRGWRRGNEVRYQTERPSEREPQAPSTPSTGAGPESARPERPAKTEDVVPENINRLVAEITKFTGSNYSTGEIRENVNRLRQQLANDPDTMEGFGVLGSDIPQLENEEHDWTTGVRSKIKKVRQDIGSGKAQIVGFQKAYTKLLFALTRNTVEPLDPRDPSSNEISLKRLRQARTDHSLNCFRGLYADRDVLYKVSQERDATVLLKEADSWSFDPGVAAVFAGTGYQGPKEDRDPVLLHFEATEDDIVSGWPFVGYPSEREIVIEGKSFGREFEATHVVKVTFAQIARELTDDKDPVKSSILTSRDAGERECWVITIRKKKTPAKKKAKRNILDLTEESNDYAMQRAIRGKDWPWYEESEPKQPTKQKLLHRKEWIPYTGPQGGRGWKETTTGEIRYQTEKPAGEAHVRPPHPEPRKPGAPEEPGRPPAKPGEIDLDSQPTPEGLNKWMEKAMQDPEVLKAKAAIEAGEYTFKKYRHEDGSYEPERQKLHDAIVERLMNPAAKAKEGEKPRVIFELGQPASGKTTVLGRYAMQIGAHWTTVSADDTKRQLPEYEGWNAALLHEESSDIAEGQLRDRAVKERHHIIMDWTGANVDKVKREIERFAEAGYDISAFYIDIPIEASVFRAFRRVKQEGRYVPLDYIRDRIDKKPLKSYEEAKKMDVVKHWAHFDNSGATVKIVDAGEREPTAGHMPTFEERLMEDWHNQKKIPEPTRALQGNHVSWALDNKIDKNNVDASLNHALEVGQETWKEFRIYRKYATPRDNSALTPEEKGIQERYRGKPNLCWYNSQLAVAADAVSPHIERTSVTYVEGIYMDTTGPFAFTPIPHGWVELNGKVLELTLDDNDRKNGIYYGVSFKQDDVLAILRAEDNGRPIAIGPARSKRRTRVEENRRRRREMGAD